MLGVKPALGRLFQPSDDDRGGGSGGPVVVISHAFWQTHFGGAPDVIGRTLTLERVPLTIVGVTPPGFFGLAPGRSFDVVIPLGVEPLIRGRESRLDRRTSWWLQVFVRLKHGQSIEAATALMQTLQPGIREATLPPSSPGRNLDRYLADPFTFVDAARGPVGSPGRLLTAAAGPDGRRGIGAADCLRQHCQSAARPRDRAQPRMERAAGAGGVARPAGAPAADRKPAARGHGRRGRCGRGSLGQPAPRRAARHGRRVSGAAAGFAHARVHRGRRPHRGARLRRGAGVARDARRAHRRDEGSRTDPRGIEPHTDGEWARPGAGRPLARAPHRRRPVPAVVQSD